MSLQDNNNRYYRGMPKVKHRVKHNAIDHIVFNTKDQTNEAVGFFERAGFSVTPRGFHTLGSINHTIVFGDDYLELLGYPPGAPPAKRPELAANRAGLMATVLQTADADASHAALVQQALRPRPVQSFSRPVDLGDGRTQDAAFRVTRLEPDAVPGTWFYYCQHLTRDLVWRPEWQAHANGATGIAALDIDVPSLREAVPLYAACLGGAAIIHTPKTLGGSGSQAIISLQRGVLRLCEAPGAARMRALTFHVASLATARSVLQRNQVAHQVVPGTGGATLDMIVIDPALTFGATLQLSELAMG